MSEDACMLNVALRPPVGESSADWVPMLASVWQQYLQAEQAQMRVACACVAAPGESDCNQSWQGHCSEGAPLGLQLLLLWPQVQLPLQHPAVLPAPPSACLH